MKSLLYIGVGAPWVGGAGFLVRQRMFLRALAEVAELHLALFDLPPDAAAARPDFVRTLTPLPATHYVPQGRLGRLITDLAFPLPRIFQTSRPAAAREILAKLNPSSFDAVFSFRIDFAYFAGVLGQPRLLLDIDDPEHLRWRRRLAATCANGGDWRTRHDLDKLARFEKRAVRGAVASFVCQENDRAPFDPPPIVVPNCVNVPPACPPRRAERPRVIFIGNFAVASANVDALNWFLDAIWPRVRAEVPECEFHVVGRLSGELESRLRSIPGAVPVGFVEDLAATMEQASLSIAPIRFGTGTRVKIIESFALGCPVVSTTLGAEGIESMHGKEILIGDNPADFARGCITLLRDPAGQARIAAAAYEIAATRYNEQARRRELVETLAQLLEKCAERGGGAVWKEQVSPGRIAAM
jgi:glycosyltransferase involved in cell wall biosynthesis